MHEIDVRTMPPPERHPLIFSTFDALPPGGGFQLVSDHDPRPLLYTFQRTRAGRYDWSFLEHGPELFRVAIGRRDPSRADVATVGDLLGHDHDRLDALMAKARAAAGAGSREVASRAFAEFRVGLERHIAGEEEHLFPAFEGLHGFSPDAGPTAVMRGEHREIERLLDDVAAALGGGQPPPFEALVAILLEHNTKEEHVLYPAVDEALDGAGRTRLCMDIQAS